ncbi:MAG: RNA-binding transcriptional accessory protein [Ignavibacteriae bacterium]|nr:RNA-binding transcriptional accessory protein [Ignavibacteriota bacterium]
MTELLLQQISNILSINIKQVTATAELLDEGATIPFISRYRKEITGSLNEMQVSDIAVELKRLTELVKRREYILKSISDNHKDKLTPELESSINNCWDLNKLEDLYLPFKPKRKTKASAAREKGLEPLAQFIMSQSSMDVISEAEKFINENVESAEDALSGARDIIAEQISEDAVARNSLRSLYKQSAVLTSKVVTKNKELGQKYQDYFDYTEELRKCPGHRLLAILRAEKEDILRIAVDVDKSMAENILKKQFIRKDVSNSSTDQISLAIEDAFKRLLTPSLENEFLKTYKEKADKEAILVFAENVRQLLLAAPLGQKRTMAIDPGFRTGCKLVCLDEQGSLLHYTTIFPHQSQNQLKDAEETVKKLIAQFKIDAIAVGNGTAGRETQSFIKNTTDDLFDIDVYMVNEAGASIYSASDAAREEFPDLDLTVRGAISIGRRLMDPLAELVKIDAKSIGVGQYQHDVDQHQLKDSLDQTVSSAVNLVGVNLNTSSQHLLQYVSGIGPKIAKAITNYRKDKGPFKSRDELLKVNGVGAKAFEQAAGFLRIPGAENPLDNSAVHPESYPVVIEMAKDLSHPVKDLISREEILKKIDIKKYVNEKTGLPTLQDIIDELKKPGLDPRGEASAFSFSKDINEIKDLKVDMRLPGIITNITKFGAFVDIGIKENGLLHISQISSTKFIKDPAEVLKLDQKVTVRVVSIDEERKRIQLSMKDF